MEFDKKELTEFLESIRLVYGYDFTEYAETSVRRRIAHFIRGHHYSSIRELAIEVLRNEALFESFVQEMSVTVTEMFRDPSFFQSIRENVIKRLSTYPLIKIWLAGCATGEEVYSIAILFREMNLLNRSILYATDINQHSLKIARDGIYPLEHMKNYTQNYIKAGGTHSFSDYYHSKYDSAIFDKTLRQNIVFSPHNLAIDRSFNEFQMIICRNVLIYFNQSLQSKVIDLFHESLCPFGFLGLGSKESLLFSEKRSHFIEIDRKEKIFMKKGQQKE